MLNSQNVTVDLDNLTIQDAAGSTPPAGLVADQLNILATNGVIQGKSHLIQGLVKLLINSYLLLPRGFDHGCAMRSALLFFIPILLT